MICFVGSVNIQFCMRSSISQITENHISFHVKDLLVIVIHTLRGE